jgi:hypothetical protein
MGQLMKPTVLLTPVEVIGRIEALSLEGLQALHQHTRDTKTNDEYVVRASEFFAHPVKAAVGPMKVRRTK